jgi:hypothetical protein
MTTSIAFFAAVLCASLIQVSQAQTLNWGSENFSTFTDSKGNLLDNTFVFELGSFGPTFTPDETNTNDWLANWQLFDLADYDQANGTFGSTVEMLRAPDPIANPNVLRSGYSGASTINFSGLTAYLWVRKGDDPVEGNEWLLTRADNWTFPLEGQDCCGKGLVEWSVSDLDSSDIPIWGRQSELDPNPLNPPIYVSTGPGVKTSDSPSTLQTFTFVPEPSSALLAAIAGIGMVMRRRRVIH